MVYSIVLDPGAHVFQSKTLDFDAFILQLVSLILPTGFIDAAPLYRLYTALHQKLKVCWSKEIHLKQAAEMPPSFLPTKL